jgi:hypothetical protein
MKSLLFRLALAGVLLTCASFLAYSNDPLSLPSGLTTETADLAIRGKVAGGILLLDLKTVMAFPAVEFTCLDPWDGKEHKFTGALLSDILARAGIEKAATRITVTAKNKYTIPIRRVDYEKNGYILAWKIDDQLFSEGKSTKNRGVFIIAIDFAKHAELDPQLFKHQLVWQANDILVE